ncbi:hypothetical protein HYW54_03130 [Candidatus Gottesmanbacteria bacterium]|nr:hypothetical protein [Candidatus Gottesmanbacteria bacterium]
MPINWTKIYNSYKGQWVALKEDEKTIITSGKTVKEVMVKSKKKGFNLPILFHVPAKSTAYIGLFQE